jgi:hypothetical protein
MLQSRDFGAVHLDGLPRFAGEVAGFLSRGQVGRSQRRAHRTGVWSGSKVCLFWLPEITNDFLACV